MHLENVVIDAEDPGALGRFWADLTGAVPITDEPGVFEARLDLGDGVFLDLCLPQVEGPSPATSRLNLGLAGGERRTQAALALGAHLLDAGCHDVEQVALTDPEGTPFVVLGPQASQPTAVAVLVLESADPARDRRFWAALTGWPDDSGPGPALRHPGGRGPRLEMCPEATPKRAGTKNRVHLDVRLDAGDDADAVIARAVELGGRELDPGWGELPWRVLADPSGNEWCLLPASG